MIMFLQQFYPGAYFDSAYEINFDRLYEDGYRGIIFDIDNTLVTHGAPANGKAIALFSHLKELGFSCCLLSNNDEPRVKMFNDSVQVQYIYKAHKPSIEGYEAAMKKMGTGRSDTFFVGDQIFTDIWGANRCGILSLMVKKIYWKEEIQIILKRRLEFFVMIGFRLFERRCGMKENSPVYLKDRYMSGQEPLRL